MRKGWVYGVGVGDGEASAGNSSIFAESPLLIDAIMQQPAVFKQGGRDKISESTLTTTDNF